MAPERHEPTQQRGRANPRQSSSWFVWNPAVRHHNGWSGERIGGRVQKLIGLGSSLPCPRISSFRHQRHDLNQFLRERSTLMIPISLLCISLLSSTVVNARNYSWPKKQNQQFSLSTYQLGSVSVFRDDCWTSSDARI